ncbi:hypothetical protein HMPREF1979_02407, partial [Actinomyces johnsonii F0542]
MPSVMGSALSRDTVYDPRNILPRKGVWGPPHDEVVSVFPIRAFSTPPAPHHNAVAPH